MSTRLSPHIALVVVSLCLALMACGEDVAEVETPPVDGPAEGKVFGEEWTFITAYTGGAGIDDDEGFFVTLADRPIGGCDGWFDIDETYRVITFQAPRQLGPTEDILSFVERNPDGAHPAVYTDTDHNPAFIIIDEITDEFIFGEIDGFADADNFVNGYFAAVICDP